MEEPLLFPFRLVGGTNLSLRYGHRKSEDIDLFTDAEYGSLNYGKIEEFLRKRFAYFDAPDKSGILAFGRMYYIGLDPDNAIKLDLMYTDRFLNAPENIIGIRMASLEEICAMKIEAIVNGGRKKDWWDIHELLNTFSLKQILGHHAEWQPWTHNTKDILEKLIDFSRVDNDADPVSLRPIAWDMVKLSIINAVRDYK
jgi:hypothetical protein